MIKSLWNMVGTAPVFHPESQSAGGDLMVTLFGLYGTRTLCVLWVTLWGPYGTTTITCTLQGWHCSSWILFDLLHTSQSRGIWGPPTAQDPAGYRGPPVSLTLIGRFTTTGSGSASRGGREWEFRFPRSNLSCSGRNEEIPVGTRTSSKTTEDLGLPKWEAPPEGTVVLTPKSKAPLAPTSKSSRS